MRHYSLPSFGSAADFLRHLAAALELPAAEATGEPDPALAALAFLEQWRLGRVPFCARAPPAEKAGVGKKAGGAAGAGSAGAAAVALVRQVYTEQVRPSLSPLPPCPLLPCLCSPPRALLRLELRPSRPMLTSRSLCPARPLPSALR